MKKFKTALLAMAVVGCAYVPLSSMATVHKVTLKPGVEQEVGHSFYCAAFAKAYETVYSSTGYPIEAHIYSIGPFADNNYKTLYKADDSLGVEAGYFGSTFTFYATNKTDKTITASINTHC